MQRIEKTIIGIVILIIAFSGVFHFWLGPHVFFKQVDAAHDIVEETYDADNAIYNYEWFKAQYEKIEAMEKKIDNTKQELDNFKELYGEPAGWGFQTRQDYNRLQRTFLGQKNHYETLVAKYNARGEMANRKIFKDKLPFNVDKKIW